MKLEKLPQLRPITKLSPTMFSLLKQCPLRAFLRVAKAQRTTVRSKEALLGIIAHCVLEKASSLNGDSESVRNQASAIWDNFVSEQEEKLRTSPLSRHLLPIRKWKRYFLLRERTLRRCKEIVLERGSSETKVVSTEQWLENATCGLTGRVDLIIRGTDGLVIVDYKTGTLVQEGQKREKKIESWRRQMLIYAVLIHAEYGEIPVWAEIRMQNKEEIKIPIVAEDAIAVAKEAVALRDDYNAQILAGASHSDLAQYSVDGCAFCEFKGSCDTFWRENPEPILGVDDYGCLSGIVGKNSWTESGVGSLVIKSANDRRWEITNLPLLQFEYLTELKQGDSVRLLDFSIVSDVSYRARPTAASVVWKAWELRCKMLAKRTTVVSSAEQEKSQSISRKVCKSDTSQSYTQRSS